MQDKFLKQSAALADVESEQQKLKRKSIERAIDGIKSILSEEGLTFNDWGFISTSLFNEIGAAANGLTVKELINKTL